MGANFMQQQMMYVHMIVDLAEAAVVQLAHLREYQDLVHAGNQFAYLDRRHAPEASDSLLNIDIKLGAA